MPMKKQDNTKRKSGRPKGAKSKLGIPSKSLQEMLELVKKAYDSVGSQLMSVDDITTKLGLQKGSNYPILGMLSDAGLIEKEGIGYRVTELAKRALYGDKNALKIAFERNSIFSDLSNHFGDQDITAGLVMAYLKQKYKKGESVELISQRFLEGRNYINASGIGKIYIKERTNEFQKENKSIDASLIQIVKLKYALSPVNKSDLSELKKSVCDELKRDSNETIRVLALNLEKNKDNDQVFSALFDSIWGIFLNDYPELKDDKQERNTKIKVKQESSKDNTSAEE